MFSKKKSSLWLSAFSSPIFLQFQPLRDLKQVLNQLYEHLHLCSTVTKLVRNWEQAILFQLCCQREGYRLQRGSCKSTVLHVIKELPRGSYTFEALAIFLATLIFHIFMSSP